MVLNAGTVWRRIAFAGNVLFAAAVSVLLLLFVLPWEGGPELTRTVLAVVWGFALVNVGVLVSTTRFLHAVLAALAVAGNVALLVLAVLAPFLLPLTVLVAVNLAALYQRALPLWKDDPWRRQPGDRPTAPDAPVIAGPIEPIPPATARPDFLRAGLMLGLPLMLAVVLVQSTTAVEDGGAGPLLFPIAAPALAGAWIALWAVATEVRRRRRVAERESHWRAGAGHCVTVAVLLVTAAELLKTAGAGGVAGADLLMVGIGLPAALYLTGLIGMMVCAIAGRSAEARVYGRVGLVIVVVMVMINLSTFGYRYALAAAAAVLG